MFLLLTGFLQSQPAGETSLGQRLVQTLAFYMRFDFRKSIVAPQRPDAPHKDEVFCEPAYPLMHYNETPTVVDPLVQTNNVTKSTCRIEEIQDVFRAALTAIWRACACPCHGSRSADEGREHSILASVFAAVISSKKMHTV